MPVPCRDDAEEDGHGVGGQPSDVGRHETRTTAEAGEHLVAAERAAVGEVSDGEHGLHPLAREYLRGGAVDAHEGGLPLDEGGGTGAVDPIVQHDALAKGVAEPGLLRETDCPEILGLRSSKQT